VPKTIKLTIAYDGTAFVGWQRQEQGVSIQGAIEEALATIEGAAVTLHGAGRTDAGVHALAQVASARISAQLDDPTMARALNANLPEAIRITAVETVTDDFHARFSATGKFYEYRIWNGPAIPPFIRLYAWHVPEPLNLAAMQEAARAIVGEHDFAGFRSAQSVNHTTVRRVWNAEWHASSDGLWCSTSPATGSCVTWCAAWRAPSSKSGAGNGRRQTWRGFSGHRTAQLRAVRRLHTDCSW
jgi:tRNA pseudouridine38-40 synthase